MTRTRASPRSRLASIPLMIFFAFSSPTWTSISLPSLPLRLRSQLRLAILIDFQSIQIGVGMDDAASD